MKGTAMNTFAMMAAIVLMVTVIVAMFGWMIAEDWDALIDFD